MGERRMKIKESETLYIYFGNKYMGEAEFFCVQNKPEIRKTWDNKPFFATVSMPEVAVRVNGILYKLIDFNHIIDSNGANKIYVKKAIYEG